MQNSSGLIVFARTPVAGQVKTRLIPAVGKQQATAIYTSLLSKTLATAQRADFSQVEVWISGNMSHPFLRNIQKRYGYRLFQQRGPHLGLRMYHAMRHALRRHHQVVLVGCDCSGLTVADLNKAQQYLLSNELVLGPADDGGYYLIGLSRITTALFEDIHWGSHRVLHETLTKVEQLGWRYVTLDSRRDIDSSRDLACLFQGKVS